MRAYALLEGDQSRKTVFVEVLEKLFHRVALNVASRPSTGVYDLRRVEEMDEVNVLE